MRKLSRKQLLLYGCSGMGVNMLNLMVGSYLCSALLTGGFDTHIEEWTYFNKDLVVPAVWSILILVAKILDGVIDLPFASFTDRLKTRWGRRRPSILIGFVPMIITYILFLFPLTKEQSLANTIWFGALICVFYAFYTLTMLTFYATFAEVCETEQDTVFLSAVKSVCDVIYFILGYALIPVFIGMDINIRYIALIFLPLSLTMLIPFFLLKEKPTNLPDDPTAPATEKPLTLGKAFLCAFGNKTFIFWMCTSFVVNIGLQLFLGGINEVFSTTGLNMTVVMASSFVPVPFTIILYNYIVKKFGFGVGYKYILTIFSIGMLIMFICCCYHESFTKLTLTLIAVFGGIFVSFAIGSFFSVTYTIPSHLAHLEHEEKGISVSSMYFAVEGVFSGISAGIATGPILVYLKDSGNIRFLPLVIIATSAVGFLLSFAFPKSIAQMGKVTKKTEQSKPEAVSE